MPVCYVHDVVYARISHARCTGQPTAVPRRHSVVVVVYGIYHTLRALLDIQIRLVVGDFTAVFVSVVFVSGLIYDTPPPPEKNGDFL